MLHRYSSSASYGAEAVSDVPQRRYMGTNGGTLGIPSFVVIQSNFPDRGRPYQAVTIFGANHPQRQAFIRELTADGMGSIRVF